MIKKVTGTSKVRKYIVHDPIFMSQIDENCIPLIGDPRFKEGVETIKELSSILLEWLTMREDTISLLKDLQKQREDSYQKRTVSKVAGANAAKVGIILGIFGFGLSFVTSGRSSLGLLIPGLKIKSLFDI